MAFFGLLKKKVKFDDEGTTNMDNNQIEKKENNVSAIEKNKLASPPKIDLIAQMANNIPANNNQNTGSVEVPMKTFDIVAFELDDDGRRKPRIINGVKGFSAQDLIALYRAEETPIKILKEYPSAVSPEQQISLPAISPVPISSTTTIVPSQRIDIPCSPTVPNVIPYTLPEIKKEPPKFFEIGGVKCKLDNGKMYQEQWVRVDATKYRLIADNTNKICPMTGKHLEMLKWIQIENTTEEETNEGEERNA